LSIATDCVYDNVIYDIVARCQQGIQGNGGFGKRGAGFDARHRLGAGGFPRRPHQ
jgi:hypothetical protein